MRSKTAFLFVIIFGIISLTYSTRLGGSSYNFLTNSLALIPPLLAAAYASRAGQTYKYTNTHGRALLILSAGLLLWFIGKVAFFLFQHVFNISPYPSVADLCFIAGYPLFFAGLMSEIRTNKASLKGVNQYIQLLIAIIMSILALAVLYFGVILAYKPGEPLLNNIVAMSYGLGDLLLIAATLYVLKMAVDFRGGKLFTSWALVLVALLLKLYGDVFFAVNRNLYTSNIWPYNMIDLVTITSFMLLAYSFYSTSSYIQEVRTRVK